MHISMSQTTKNVNFNGFRYSNILNNSLSLPFSLSLAIAANVDVRLIIGKHEEKIKLEQLNARIFEEKRMQSNQNTFIA